MEPTVERWDDVELDVPQLGNAAAAMEPTVERSDDCRDPRGSDPCTRAAMEPTVERSDDAPWEQPFLTASSAAMEPTVERSDDQDANPVVMDIVLPQWSRPWNGRMTRRTQASSDGSGSAAMEPTVERSDDQGCPAHRVPAGTGRNGADRGTVG